MGYRGRFAPSPTGRLHLGSLFVAVGSYLDARARSGAWLVRIEDVDRAREVPGAAADILRTLEAFGLLWDGPVLYQSTRGEAYAQALACLAAAGLTYECCCSRAELTAEGGEARYPGTCREGPRRRDAPLATRFRTGGFAPVTVEDRLQRPYTESVEATVGDFVLRRRDGFWSYQLAVVVDDAFQGITDVVRGLDLLDNTPRQRLLQAALGLPSPRTLHLPLLVERDGGKLSKSRRALPVDPARPPAVLTEVLSLLRHALPAELQHAPVAEQLTWATAAWNPSLLQGVREIVVGPPV
jgi:glutamyl-Q tRNA(Asp) synthetase